MADVRKFFHCGRCGFRRWVKYVPDACPSCGEAERVMVRVETPKERWRRKRGRPRGLGADSTHPVRSSSTVERLAVNQEAAGSSPASAAISPAAGTVGGAALDVGGARAPGGVDG